MRAAATLAGGATAPHDFCVASIDTTPTAGISMVGFTIQPDSACASGLAVQIST
jgi:hypothetical protein